MSTTLNKLNYLDTTKGQIKTALNQFGSGITDDPFRSYVDKIEDIYDSWEKVTGEGTSVTLDNTKVSKLIINPKGNITQDGEPSPSNEVPVKVVDGSYDLLEQNKNLLINNLVSGTKNGIDYVVNLDKSITISGTATNTTWLVLNTSITLQAGTYIMSQGNNNNTVRLFCSAMGGYVYNGVKTTTLINSATSDISINIPNGTVLTTPITIYPMVVKSSTVTPYVAHAQQTKTIDTSPNPLYSENDYYYKSNGNW